MFVSECLNVNNKGHLTIGGCDTLELAKEFGTPLYVLDETTIRNVCKAYVKSFEKYYHGNGMPLYASKALSCKELCRIAKEEGLGLDVVSGGEMGKKANISFRIKPGVDAHTHNFIRTGQIDSKFGFALETGEAFEAVKKAQMYDNVNLTELHCHIGSQIFDIDPFVTAAEIMLDFMGKIHDELGIVISELNLGGGFGIMYTKDDEPVPYENYMEKVSEAVKAKAKEHGLPVPYIFIEPGRSIVGEAGITLYKVGGKKEIPNVRTYVSVDGGMTDNIRYALYQSAYTVVNAGKADKEPDEIVTVAGKCCESGDLVQEHTKVAKVEVGDTLAVLSTGAYNYSMASNYNRIPRPAIVMVKDGKARVVVKRESYEDIVKNDI